MLEFQSFEFEISKHDSFFKSALCVQVTGRNAEEYCNQVVAAILEKGVRAQVDSFLSGVDSVLDSRQLQCLYEVRCTDFSPLSSAEASSKFFM